MNIQEYIDKTSFGKLSVYTIVSGVLLTIIMGWLAYLVVYCTDWASWIKYPLGILIVLILCLILYIIICFLFLILLYKERHEIKGKIVSFIQSLLRGLNRFL